MLSLCWWQLPRPPVFSFFRCFLRKPITVSELLKIGTTTTRLLFVFLCFFYQKCAIAVVEPRTTPLSILFFCVYCWVFLAEAHHSGCLGDSLGDAWHDLVRFSNSLGCELGNLTRHDLPSHNNTNLNHPVTTSHFPNSQNFPNLPKYKDKR